MITDKRYAPEGADYCMEEIFVVRPFRGTGAARNAVRRLFEAHPGSWCLEVYGENLRAKAFWTRILSEWDESARERLLPDGLVRMKFHIRAEADRK